MQELGYSFSLTTFSPTGHLWQIQHALAASNRSRTSIGIRAKNGIALITQRKIDEPSEILVDQSSVKLIENVAPHIGITFSGLQADFRPIIALAREKAVMYEAVYGEPIPLKMLCKSLAKIYQEKTQQGGVRPFGCSILLAGYDYIVNNDKTEQQQALYQIDPSGSFFKLKCWSNGKNNDQIRQQLEKRIGEDLKDPELDDAIVAGLALMRENSDIELSANDIVVGILEKNNVFKQLSKQDIVHYFKNIE